MTVTPIVKLDGMNVSSIVASTGRAAHIDHYAAPTALGERAHAGVAAPISIAGKLWGTVGAARTGDGGLPPHAEERAARFADLAAIAISNAEARELLAERASTDELTKLANYRAFHERLRLEVERAIRHGRQLSLVLIDIDGFKAVNDAHGHPTGDAVLEETARRLTAQMRETDMVARVGGEEFALLLPETGAADAFAVAERARRAVDHRPYEVAGHLAISAGVCSLADAGDAEAMLRLADRALYLAKNHGRNMTFRHAGESEPGGLPSRALLQSIAQA
jgi:diguanylate cyclase (GGDEF)-like protein